MAELKYSTLDSLFDATCDSIRTQLGTTDLINHQDIPEKILEIVGNNAGNVGGFEWKTLTVNSDKTFTIPLENDPYLVLLSQDCDVVHVHAMLYPTGDMKRTLINAGTAEYLSSHSAVSYSNLKIQNNTLSGAMSVPAYTSRYALIPLESTGTSSDTNFETWVFTLEDGSTVEKEIEVGA